MSTKGEVCQGTLARMKTRNAMGSQRWYGIARRIEQTSDKLLSINHCTLYPVLLKLEQEGAIAPQWDVSENNRSRVLPDHQGRPETTRASEVTVWLVTRQRTAALRIEQAL
jgi:hypothetical protein